VTVRFPAIDGSMTGVVVATHAPALVALSILISILGAYAATGLMERARNIRGRAWLLWLAGAATVDGIGTWSMHYTGKLALRLPLPLYFDCRLVALSLAVGIAGSAAALLVVGQHDLTRGRALAAGILLGGAGISGLHYTAMAAVIRPRIHHYHSPLLVVLSIAVAIVMSCLSVPLSFRWSVAMARSRLFRTGASAVVRGAANPAMHYTAMTGVAFAYPQGPPPPHYAVSIASIGVIGISIVPVTVLAVAVLTSFIDRLQKERAVLDKLFDQTPEAVAVTSDDGRVVRVNRQFTLLFGYAPEEAIGRRLEELIGGGDEPAAAADGRLSLEGARRRKDGRRLDVAGVAVQVPMPSGATERYLLMRDVTEQKRTEEALRLYPRRLLETQEAERQRIARELHDEIGQMLTGIGMSLGSTQGMPPEHKARISEARSGLHELTARVRGLALDLRPSLLDDLGLLRALLTLFQRYERQTGIRIAFEHTGLEERRFAPEVEITAYRIVQEALTNVARHAGVDEAQVRISCDDRSLSVEVKDCGAGFDAVRLSPSTVGLAGMRERATALGGRLTLTSSAGGGTRVAATLPLRPGSDSGDEARRS
jgi:PAS domain S-box-containing protein